MPFFSRNGFRRHSRLPVVVLQVLVVMTLCLPCHAEEAVKSSASNFREKVAPLLQKRCVSCHGHALEMGDLRLDRREDLRNDDLIKKGNAKESLFMKRLVKSEAGIRMPPTGSGLSGAEKKIFESWINEGASLPDDAELFFQGGQTPEDSEAVRLFREIRDAKHKAVQRRLQSSPHLINAADRDGYTPLLVAAYCSSPKCVKTILEFGPNLEAKDGKSALHYAVSTGDSKAVAKLLLSRGARIDLADKSKRTALGYAASQQQTGLLDFLVHQGADPKGVAPSHLARNKHAIELLADDRFYKDESALSDAIQSAVMRGEVEFTTSLLLRSAPAGKRYSSGQTALIRAAYSEASSPGLLQTLIAYGADPKSRDKLEQSALDWAKTKGDTEMVGYLEGLVGSEDKGSVPSSPELGEEPPGEMQRRPSPREAAQAGLRLLQRSNLRFFRKSGCIACHQQPITSLAVSLARERGYDFRAEPARIQSQLYSIILDANRSRYLKGEAFGGNQDTTSAILFGLSAERYGRTDATDAMAIQLAARQRDDGSWPTSGHRPPSEYSSLSTTAFAIHALNAYAPPGLVLELKGRVANARQWLLQSDPQALQEHATKLLGLRWSKAPEDSIATMRERLLNKQREDGGWSQRATLSSDAYATGLALYALREGGHLPGDHAAYRRGMDFLLRTQLADGSWYVRGRSLKFQPYFESGFPHDEDQWISAHATGWAVIALMIGERN
jgi:ankyrin repeat protein